MTRSAWLALGVVVAGTMAITAGCDGSAPIVMTGGSGGRPTTGGSGGGGGGATGGSGGGGGFVVGGGGGTTVMRPKPTIPEGARRVVGARTRMIGGGISSCTNAEPPLGDGDRWCGFYAPNQQQLGRFELWVINVTKAETVDVKCDGTDANCLRLTTNLWSGSPDFGPFHPVSHRFDGDTLVFYANTAPTVEFYEGPIYAWRPGWPEARQLISRAFTCSAHSSKDVAVCLGPLQGTEPDAETIEFDLHAGKLPTAANTSLPKVAHIFPLRNLDGPSQWQSGFTRDGSKFLYSTGPKRVANAGTDVEKLYIVNTDDLADGVFVNDDPKCSVCTELGANVHNWRISADGTKLFYLDAYNFSVDGDPCGNLKMADFPTFANPTTLVAGNCQDTTFANRGVGAYLVLTADNGATDRGLGVFTKVGQGRGTFEIMADRTAPGTRTKVVDGIGSAAVSPDLRYTLYSTEFNEDEGTANFSIAKNDGSGKCTLTAQPRSQLYGSPFTNPAGLVFWADNVDVTVGVGDMWRADPATCAKTKITEGVFFWYVMGDKIVVWNDDTDSTDAQNPIATLRYQFLNGGAWPSSPAKGNELQQQASLVFSLLLPGFHSVVYQMATLTHEDVDGLYLFKFPAAP